MLNRILHYKKQWLSVSGIAFNVLKIHVINKYDCSGTKITEVSTSSFFSLVEKCQALAICSFLFSFPPFFNVKTMALDSGWGAWTKKSRSKISTCDPVGSSSVLGLECDVGLAAPLNSLPGTVGISWKTVWEWLNKQWKQQQEGKQKTAWAWHCFFELYTGLPRL